MSQKSSGSLAVPATTPPIGVGTGWFPAEGFNLDWHRAQIHKSAQHGCVLCPPTPCACGYTGKLCPDYFQHRRDQAGAETSWREVAV